MRGPLHPLADDDPSVDAELTRMREDDEREAGIELLACLDHTPEKSDLLYDRMEAENYSSFDLDGTVW